MYISGKALSHHFVPNATIQSTHIHTTFDISSKNGYITTLSHSTSKWRQQGDASTTLLLLQVEIDDILVFVNGVCLTPTDDYTISGTTLTFVTALAASREITIRFFLLK